MPIDITTIPYEELLQDLEDSQQDIVMCEFALAIQITESCGRQIQERLDVNKKIVQVITAELNRRAELEQEIKGHEQSVQTVS